MLIDKYLTIKKIEKNKNVSRETFYKYTFLCMFIQYIYTFICMFIHEHLFICSYDCMLICKSYPHSYPHVDKVIHMVWITQKICG